MNTSRNAISFPRKAEAAGSARRVSSELTFAAASTSPPRSTIALPSEDDPSQFEVQRAIDVGTPGEDAKTSGANAFASTSATPATEVLEDVGSAVPVSDNK